MKTIPLTLGYSAVVDDADYERVAQFKWYAEEVRKKDGTIKAVYAKRTRRDGNGKHTEAMHRFILRLTDRSIDCDHKDHNGINNRRKNLRICTQSQNNANARVRHSSVSGFKGVTWEANRKRWRACATIDGKRKHIGYYVDKCEASKAYAVVAREMFGEFSCVGL